MKLIEIDPARLAQSAPGLKTRWFHDEGGDLFVWHRDDGQVMAFQFTVGTEILTWSVEDGMKTGLVDDGEVGRTEPYKMAPIIHADAAPDPGRRARLGRELEAAVEGMDLAKQLGQVLSASPT